jgi:hypothetical protein
VQQLLWKTPLKQTLRLQSERISGTGSTECWFTGQEKRRALAFLMTLVSLPIQTIITNFSLCDSLSLENLTRAYPKEALE